jgi:protein subunit release factor A
MADKELIFSVRKSDLKIVAFCAGGPGGQHQNKVATAIRITHKETGISATSREHKSQHRNRKAAFRRLADKLVAHYVKEDQRQRYGSTRVVRTYHKPDDRIVDHDTGLRYSYREVMGKGKATKAQEMIADRAYHMLMREFVDEAGDTP